jgi:hypothetical protein
MYLFIVSEGSASTYENVKKDCETKLFKAWRETTFQENPVVKKSF